MNNNERKLQEVSEAKCTKFELICIALSYILIYGILMIVTKLFADNAYVALVILVIFVICTWKSSKELIVNHLSALSWPVFLVLTFFLSVLIGLFTAPFYAGRWVGRKINFNRIEVQAYDGNNEALFLLGTFYVNGYGVEKNTEIGIKKIRQASNNGNQNAIQFLKEKGI